MRRRHLAGEEVEASFESTSEDRPEETAAPAEVDAATNAEEAAVAGTPPNTEAAPGEPLPLFDEAGQLMPPPTMVQELIAMHPLVLYCFCYLVLCCLVLLSYSAALYATAWHSVAWYADTSHSAGVCEGISLAAVCSGSRSDSASRRLRVSAAGWCLARGLSAASQLLGASVVGASQALWLVS